MSISPGVTINPFALNISQSRGILFDELLDKVKDAPEAQQEALKILIQQIRQIGEQMRQVRDMKNLQEMKKLMMQHWKELEELAGGNPELLKT